jgi:hypothetical protein
VIAAIAVIARNRKTILTRDQAWLPSFSAFQRFAVLNFWGSLAISGDFGNLFLFAFSQFPA